MSTPAHTPTIEAAELTIEEEAQKALVKANLTDEKIAELLAEANKYLTPIETTERYLEVKEAEKRIAKVRRIGDKNLDAIDRRRIDTNKYQMQMVQELRAKIHEPELLLASVIKPWEAEVKRKQEEEEAAIQDMREERKNSLLALGYVFVQGPPEHKYELEGVSTSARDIMDMDELTWKNRFNDLRMHGEQVAERKAEEKRKRIEEAQRLEVQRKDQEEREAEIARKEAEIKAREEAAAAAELAAAQAEVQALENTRLAELATLGVDKDMHYEQHDLSVDVEAPLADYEPFEWPAVVARVKELVGRIEAKKQEQKEARERQLLIDSRVKALKEAGWEDDQGESINALALMMPDKIDSIAVSYLAKLSEPDINECIANGRAELARRKKEEEDRQAELQRRENEMNKAGAEAHQRTEGPTNGLLSQTHSDLELWKNWIHNIRNSAPNLDSAIGKQAVKKVLEYVDGLTLGVERDLK
ncbi:MAG TPA: hypothetical protein PLN12_15105 [Flavobacteriales bacterium]|nr:hypothetical protein [Flavobacteriales bacterium]